MDQFILSVSFDICSDFIIHIHKSMGLTKRDFSQSGKRTGNIVWALKYRIDFPLIVTEVLALNLQSECAFHLMNPE